VLVYLAEDFDPWVFTAH